MEPLSGDGWGWWWSAGLASLGLVFGVGFAWVVWDVVRAKAWGFGCVRLRRCWSASRARRAGAWAWASCRAVRPAPRCSSRTRTFLQTWRPFQAVTDSCFLGWEIKAARGGYCPSVAAWTDVQPQLGNELTDAWAFARVRRRLSPSLCSPGTAADSEYWRVLASTGEYQPVLASTGAIGQAGAIGQPFRALGADHHTALTRLNPAATRGTVFAHYSPLRPARRTLRATLPLCLRRSTGVCVSWWWLCPRSRTLTPRSRLPWVVHQAASAGENKWLVGPHLTRLPALVAIASLRTVMLTR